MQKNNKLALPKPTNNACDAVDKDEKVSLILRYRFLSDSRKLNLPLC